LIGAAFGLGFILGPAMGGFLSTWGYAVPAFAAAGLAAVNLISVVVNLPESLTKEVRTQLAEQQRPSFSLNALWQALNRKRVGPLLNIRFFYGLAFATFQTIFPLYAQYRLALDARQTGFVLTYVGVLAALVQGVGVGMLAKRYSDAKLIFSSVLLMTAALLAWAFVPTVWWLLVVLVPLALAGGVLNTVLNSALTKVVYPEEVGGTLGLSASLESATRVLAPSMGGILLGQIGTWAPGIFGTVLMVWVATFAWRKLIRHPDPPLPPREKVSGNAISKT
jgi:DHA1 family tetracycline resistance protein-like MFS transporter